VKKKSLVGYIDRSWEKHYKFNRRGYVEDRDAALVLSKKSCFNDVKVKITIEETK